MSKSLFLLILLLVNAPSFAMTGIFWQPQLRDNLASDTSWHSLMQTLHHQGFDTLVIQWTRYGEAFANETERALLLKKAQAARQAGLKVIIGLNADPDFFTRQKQPLAAQANYLNRLLVQDRRQARLWVKTMGFQPDGWYISAEIDDSNWRDKAARGQMTKWLSDTRRQLVAVAQKPVYISSFFSGNMSPEGYRQLVADIEEAGVKVLIQDGGGVGKLNAVQRELYLQASAGCEVNTPGSGIVYEIFTANPGKVFSAQPQSPAKIQQLLERGSLCGKNRLYFSLRYLPAARNVLRND